MPTLTEMMYKKSKERSSKIKGIMYDALSKAYGGEEHYEGNDIAYNNIVNQDMGDNYIEYDIKGEIIRKTDDKKAASRYPEDQYINDHTSVWGSWWNKTLNWGYTCCHSNEKYSGCLGRRGMKLAIIKEYKIVKMKEIE